MTGMEQLRAIRAELPNGKKDPWGECCKSKRVLLIRALKKENVATFTDGELTAFNEWLEHISAVRKENKEFAKVIQKITKK